MLRRFIVSFFFSNWFLGVLAVALSVETNFQLGLPLNAPMWYALLFATVVLYYTYAYQSAMTGVIPHNPRTSWYANHKLPVKASQAVLLILAVSASVVFLFRHYPNFGALSGSSLLIPLLAVLAALSYYDKIRFFNLRFAGWTKPLTIGFCWAVAVSILPLIALQLEAGPLHTSVLLPTWLFFKNWMFCSANAILFDIKDFEDDTNKALKTFVVRYGIHFTIFFIVLPMIVSGILSFLFFAVYRGLNMVQVAVNLIPFVLTLYLALALQKKRSILYYLIVIDGMLLVKAVCGIVAATVFVSV